MVSVMPCTAGTGWTRGVVHCDVDGRLAGERRAGGRGGALARRAMAARTPMAPLPGVIRNVWMAISIVRTTFWSTNEHGHGAGVGGTMRISAADKPH